MGSVSGYVTGQAGVQESRFRDKQFQMSARMKEYEKQDILANADSKIQERGIIARQMIGSQKTAYAGQGIDLSSEVVEAVREDTKAFQMEDIQAIRNNAWNAIWGIETEQFNMLQEGRLGIASAKYRRRAGVFGGAVSDVEAYYTSGASNKQKNKTDKNNANQRGD